LRFAQHFWHPRKKPFVKVDSSFFLRRLCSIWPQQKSRLAMLCYDDFAFGLDKVPDLGELRT